MICLQATVLISISGPTLIVINSSC